MTTSRITTEHPDLAPVFGPLEDGERDAVATALASADACLSTLHASLAERSGGTWRFDGVVLETSISGQASVEAQLEDAGGKLTFAMQLRPRNFFPTEEAMWQPGRPPLQMATDAWDVDGTIAVRYKTRVAGRPYTIQRIVHPIEEQRYESATEAAEAFAAIAEELSTLAASRDPNVDAWRPAEEEAAAG